MSSVEERIVKLEREIGDLRFMVEMKCMELERLLEERK